jgi:hypothetical protein
MTTPTSNISLATNVQAEFGGSTPTSLSEYYRSGAYVPANQTTSGTDGRAIPSSGSVSLGMFRGITKTPAGNIVTGSSISLAHQLTGAAPISAMIVFETDGTVSASDTANLITLTPPMTNWVTPTTTNIGAAYWIRITTISNTGTILGAPGGWQSLNLPRGVGIQTAVLNQSKYGNFTIEFSTNSAGTNIVSTWTLNITVSNIPVQLFTGTMTPGGPFTFAAGQLRYGYADNGIWGSGVIGSMSGGTGPNTVRGLFYRTDTNDTILVLAGDILTDVLVSRTTVGSSSFVFTGHTNSGTLGHYSTFRAAGNPLNFQNNQTTQTITVTQ